MSRVVHIESEEQFNKCIHDVKFATTIVDFSATWCGPCVGIAPFYEELSKNNNEIQFLSVDVDEFATLAQQANIRAMPTFVVYKDGVLTEQKLQGADRHGLTEIIKSIRKGPTSGSYKNQAQASAEEKGSSKKKKKCTIL